MNPVTEGQLSNKNMKAERAHHRDHEYSGPSKLLESHCQLGLSRNLDYKFYYLGKMCILKPQITVINTNFHGEQ